ncbi:hypothetical protein FZD47_23975 [Bacillus infantis]|uniref:Helix-turn-helix transcriptional regulator n=1 Tax=Bacillus infantis TaxID=324767 RepID=A0A5D4S2N0_9BACI|nr:hypothetical protein [Bacillus infantis]TYS57897.1 hypothetical protein FZD47_23975 [Bacillus infantis]
MAKNRLSIRVNEKELKKAAIDHQLDTNEKIAKAIGISVSQLWRATLSPSDPRYNNPGSAFIAGVLNVFGDPFERFFFLEPKVASSQQKGDIHD